MLQTLLVRHSPSKLQLCTARLQTATATSHALSVLVHKDEVSVPQQTSSNQEVSSMRMSYGSHPHIECAGLPAAPSARLDVLTNDMIGTSDYFCCFQDPSSSLHFGNISRLLDARLTIERTSLAFLQRHTCSSVALSHSSPDRHMLLAGPC